MEGMLIEKIEELREKVNEQIVNNNKDEKKLLTLSNDLDRYIAEYLKSIMGDSSKHC